MEARRVTNYYFVYVCVIPSGRVFFKLEGRFNGLRSVGGRGLGDGNRILSRVF
jgi:hypothetical protein